MILISLAMPAVPFDAPKTLGTSAVCERISKLRRDIFHKH
jgi:hypothetical protein